MAKKAVGFVKLQIPAGKANPAPPVGTALGPQGINIMAFCKEFNARTQCQDTILPVEITIYAFALWICAETVAVAAIRVEWCDYYLDSLCRYSAATRYFLPKSGIPKPDISRVRRSTSSSRLRSRSSMRP